MNHQVLSLEYICILTGQQPADVFGDEQNYCKLMLHLTDKYAFENFGEGNFPVAPLLVAALLSNYKESRPSHWL